jgi:putative hemolysin
MRRKAIVAVLGLGVTCLTAAGAVLAVAGDTGTAAKAPKTAAEYCRSKGGSVQARYPAWGTNDPSPLRLAGSVRFCRWVSPEDGSRIFVALDTLYATRPSLAVLAYLTKPPVGEIPAGPNPASIYCGRLGGTDAWGGVSAAGGGYVSETDTLDPVLQTCVFPDRSIIDAWGLTYHSWGTVRGKDLTRIFRYHPASPPQVFAGP